MAEASWVSGLLGVGAGPRKWAGPRSKELRTAGCVCSCWGSLSALVLAPQGDWAQPPSGSLLVLALGPAEVLEAGRAPGPLSSNPSPFQRRRPQRKGFAPFFPSSSWRGQPPPTCLLAFAPPASRHVLNRQSELQSGPEVGPQVRGEPQASLQSLPRLLPGVQAHSEGRGRACTC